VTPRTAFVVGPATWCGKDAGVDPVSGVGGDPRSASSLRRLVADHPARDEREVISKARFLDELVRLSDPCEAGADPVHVTASGVVAGRRGTVLHLHRRMGRWMQPGGHVEADEPPASAARREAEEETGLEVDHPPDGPVLINLDVHEAMDGHTHLDLRYLLLGPDTDPRPPLNESQEVRWFGWDEAEAMADEALVGALRAGREVWDRSAERWGHDEEMHA
jgi:8-oxo-dGTP pyrophosphatase MutT (NUDIX family)